MLHMRRWCPTQSATNMPSETTIIAICICSCCMRSILPTIYILFVALHIHTHIFQLYISTQHFNNARAHARSHKIVSIISLHPFPFHSTRAFLIILYIWICTIYLLYTVVGWPIFYCCGKLYFSHRVFLEIRK